MQIVRSKIKFQIWLSIAVKSTGTNLINVQALLWKWCIHSLGKLGLHNYVHVKRLWPLIFFLWMEYLCHIFSFIPRYNCHVSLKVLCYFWKVWLVFKIKCRQWDVYFKRLDHDTLEILNAVSSTYDTLCFYFCWYKELTFLLRCNSLLCFHV